MAETADFELVQAVRGMDGRISDPSARMTSKVDRSKQRRGLGNPVAKSREVHTTTLNIFLSWLTTAPSSDHFM